MKTIALAALALSLLQERPRASDGPRVSLQEVTRSGKRVTVTISCDLPEQTVLKVIFAELRERLIHGREVWLACVPVEEPVSEGVEVKKKRAVATVELPRQGLYRVIVIFSRTGQIYEEVLKQVGNVTDWERTFDVTLAEPGRHIEALESHEERAAQWIEDAQKMVDEVGRAVQDQAAWRRNHARVLERVAQLRSKALAYAEESPYPGVMGTVCEALNKTFNFNPAVIKYNFEEGSAAEEKLRANSPDIPEAGSDRLLMQLVQAYLERARRALPRERFIAPVRIAVQAWHRAALAAGDARVNAAQVEAGIKEAEAWLGAVDEGHKDIEKKYQKDKDNINHAWAAGFRPYGPEMLSLARQRLQARGGAEEPPRVPVDDLKARLDAFEKGVRRVFP